MFCDIHTIAEAITLHGAAGAIEADLEQLFRRVLFNVLVGNRDDHLRNHGFLRRATGWVLAPAFDVNPNPHRRDHVLTLDGKVAIPDPAVVLETHDLYRLSTKRAQALLDEVRTAVSAWQQVARRLGLASDEIARMQPVFAV